MCAPIKLLLQSVSFPNVKHDVCFKMKIFMSFYSLICMTNVNCAKIFPTIIYFPCVSLEQ